MTTIAYKDGIVAADSQSTAGFKSFSAVKIHRVASGPFAGYVIGIAGRYALLSVIRAQVEAGEFQGIQPKDEDDGAFALLIGRKNAFRLESDTMCPAPIKAPYAIGSGEAFAMGAMLAGKSAEEAVKIAAKLDIYTGGKVRLLEV